MAKYCSEEISSSFSDFPSRLYQRRFKLELIRNHGNLSPWLENFHRRPQSAASERRANGIVVRGRGSRSHDSRTRAQALSLRSGENSSSRISAEKCLHLANLLEE